MERRRGFDLGEELRIIAPLLVVWLLALAVLAAVASTDDGHQRLLLQSPVTSADLPWYTGLIAYMSLCAWCVALTAGLGGAFVARLADRERAGRFLAHAGLLTALLMCNEILGLHYDLVPALGVPKIVAVGGLAILCAAWVIVHVHEIRRTRTVVLVLAAGAIGASLVLDTVGGGSLPVLLMEEGLQLCGVIGWATYVVVTVGDIARSIVRRPRVTADEEFGDHRRDLLSAN